MINNNIICLNNVIKEIGRKEILKNISFNVKKGEVFGYIGPNGAGKTTTIKLILGILSLNKGNIQIFGKNISELDYSEKKKISCVLDRDGLDSFLTCFENIEYYAKIYEIPDYKDKIYLWLKRLNIEEYADSRVKTLSKGLKRIVSLARVFVVCSDLIILDEPFNGLDPTVQIEVRNIIKEISEQNGTTVFISSHNLAHMEKICDSIAFIHKGELKLCDDIEKLHKLYGAEGMIIKADSEEIKKLEKILKNRDLFNNRFSVFNDSILIKENRKDTFSLITDLTKKFNIIINSIGKNEISLESI